MTTKDITRPPADLVEKIRRIGAATTSSTLFHMGIHSSHIYGPVAWTRGKTIAGPALTLQFMPKREDLYGEDEYADPERQLHRHVLYHTQPGDIVVVDARGDMRSGHSGRYWIGSYEAARSDKPRGTLTSAAFVLDQPYASFLVGGGENSATRVEIVRQDSGEVVFQASGRDDEEMAVVDADLSAHVGKPVFVKKAS